MAPYLRATSEIRILHAYLLDARPNPGGPAGKVARGIFSGPDRVLKDDWRLGGNNDGTKGRVNVDGEGEAKVG